jgi:hypothetical protein
VLAGAELALERDGQPTIQGRCTRSTPNLVSAWFDLTAVAPGAWRTAIG